MTAANETKMAKNYAEIAFTESVKEQQKIHGSRQQYERVEKMARGTELTFAEADFIAARDSFYLATVGENNQPYVQFRGGPTGFLKVLDATTLAYADFRGNLQYISVGNLAVNNRASLILIDYPNRRRLKIFARLEIIRAADAPDLIAKIADAAYPAVIERAVILHLEAFDWNCPQHITPRYTLEEIRAINAPLYEHIAKLEIEIKRLKGDS
ncbi:MAG TPA: pyridoxamine 5'-phosphate oxidase family protein [Pyrinomonadaceae bacterium]|nr:pyridoxamine 5'-phosphate oxidase family protein [Pyrinomonadaceae bacterium]